MPTSKRGPGSIVTMRDIAAAAEVSQSTVSRVLSGAPTSVPIAPETRERVLRASRRLGYRPNPLARGLRGASTNLIGAVVRDFSDPFFAGAIEALVLESMAHGYNVVLGHAHGGLDEVVSLTSVLETRHTDAIILLGDMQLQPRLLADLRSSSVPVVGLWQGTSPLEFPTADTDDRAGIRAGLEHLESLGHRRIAFLSADLPPGVALEELRWDPRREPVAVPRPDLGEVVVGVAVPVVRGPSPGSGPAGAGGDPASAGPDQLSAGAVPYFAWANRGAEAMRVWIPR